MEKHWKEVNECAIASAGKVIPGYRSVAVEAAITVDTSVLV